MFFLVAIILLAASHQKTEGCENWQVIDQQINFTSNSNGRQHPGPLNQNLSKVIRVTDKSPPTRNQKLTSTSCLQNSFCFGATWVLCKFTSLGFRSTENDVSKGIKKSNSNQIVPRHGRLSFNEVFCDQCWQKWETVIR